MSISPLMLLAGLLTITLLVVIVQVVLRAREMSALARLAAEKKLNYSATDHLRLASRVAEHFPIPGAASLRIYDLLYGTTAERYRYVFTAEYTVGVVKSKSRVRRACTFTEPRQHSDRVSPQIVMGDGHLPLIDQYHLLLERRADTSA